MDNKKNVLERIRNIVEKSSISNGDKKDFVNFVSRADNKNLETVLDLISEDVGFVEVLNHNYKMKILAMRGAGSWKDVSSEEERIISLLK